MYLYVCLKPKIFFSKFVNIVRFSLPFLAEKVFHLPVIKVVGSIIFVKKNGM